MILASDFDKTLYVEDKEQFQKNISAIKKWKEHNTFIITTGRGFSSISTLIKKYQIPYDYLICGNGAIIFDSQENIIESTYLNKEDIENTINIIKKYNLNYILDNGTEYIYDLTEQKLCCIYIEKTNINDINEIMNLINQNTNTYHYQSDHYICVENKNIRKDKSLKEIGKILNIDKIYCIGDAINDIEMIKKFNGGIMKNHEKELNSLPNKNYSSLSEYINELI